MIILSKLFIFLHAAITCDQLNNPQNGNVQQPLPPTVGSVAVYSCNQGFRLVGVTKRACQSDRTYTGKAPVCVGMLAVMDYFSTQSLFLIYSYCV